MQKSIIAAFLFFLMAGTALGQLPNKVGSLLTADRSLARLVKDSTPHQALLAATSKDAIYFAPGPVNGVDFLKNRPNIPDLMRWEPSFAGIAKSMELGFTTGRIDFQRIGAPQRHGEYLIIWKRNNKGEWKIQARAVMNHYGKPDSRPALAFVEPDSTDYLRQRSQARLQQRTDIIASNDKLFATVLRSDNQIAFKEFLTEDVRFYFPWNNPIHGKEEVLTFLGDNKIEIETIPQDEDRSYSGELAYSYGHANVAIDTDIKRFNYIRIWQRQSDHQWRVMLEFYSEK